MEVNYNNGQFMSSIPKYKNIHSYILGLIFLIFNTDQQVETRLILKSANYGWRIMHHTDTKKKNDFTSS